MSKKIKLTKYQLIIVAWKCPQGISRMTVGYVVKNKKGYLVLAQSAEIHYEKDDKFIPRAMTIVAKDSIEEIYVSPDVTDWIMVFRKSETEVGE